MCWSYDRRTYNDCRPCIVLSVVVPLPHFKAVNSVQPKTKGTMTRTHWLNEWHRCSHICKRRLRHRNDALPLNFNHTTLYAYSVIACDGNTIRMWSKSDNAAMTTDLMVIIL